MEVAEKVMEVQEEVGDKISFVNLKQIERQPKKI